MALTYALYLLLAEKYYDGENPAFKPKKRPDKEASLTKREESQITKIHQAIAMIQFKLEMPIIKRRPSFEMEERLVLEKIDYNKMKLQFTVKHTLLRTHVSKL